MILGALICLIVIIWFITRLFQEIVDVAKYGPNYEYQNAIFPKPRSWQNEDCSQSPVKRIRTPFKAKPQKYIPQSVWTCSSSPRR